MSNAKFYITENTNQIIIELKGHFDNIEHCAFFTGAFYATAQQLSKKAKTISREGYKYYEAITPEDIKKLKKFIDFIVEWIGICEQENPLYKIPIIFKS